MATRHSRERDLLHAAEHPPEGETCPECSGSGYVSPGHPYPVGWDMQACSRCDGLGYLLPDGDALADEAGDREYDRRNDR